MASPAPAGTGARFKALKTKLATRGAADPSALAAWIGDRKYGKAGMAAMAAAGRKPNPLKKKS